MLLRVRVLLAALLLAAGAGSPLCPPGSTPAGGPPPDGWEAWCERPDVSGKPRRHGPSRSWYDDGGLRSEATWRDGILDGPFVEYHRGGLRARQGEYREGEKQGMWRIWFQSGVLEEEAEFERGRLQGRFASFWPNGRKRAEGRFCLDIQCGRWTSWSEDGAELGSVVHEEIRGTP
jgi:antitoxin component YwqK of YwqJK toxin-antitoxin module